MDEMYVKPGNQERGWNDPPQFSYGLQTARTPQKNLLNKRPTLPDAAALPTTLPSGPSGPPPCGLAPPPAGCAPAWKATPPEGAAGRIGGVEDPGQSEAEPNLEDVVEVLERVLARCRVDVAPQVCNDMEKRLRLFEDSWTSGRLSLPVRRRMSALSQELQAGHWDQADEIHRSLMVDYVTEVSQWMVGVKRLIAESRGPKP
ncbi:steroid receptor RNA activator 1 isoform X1 [Syngnathus typhle]|uniref:steroid receptor RNA activator 1 isoform X1 n=1 Tax=Syngnathus typhle TaxID=161592 RepID=UPI002A6B090A|nr:steroid receptor RNA activator 1 isoform X1 [Syngnathus typhle]